MTSHYFSADCLPCGTVSPGHGWYPLQLSSPELSTGSGSEFLKHLPCDRETVLACTWVIAFYSLNDAGVPWFQLRNAWAFKPELMLFHGVKVRMLSVQVSEMLSTCLSQRENLLAHVTKKFTGRVGFKHGSAPVPPQVRNLHLSLFTLLSSRLGSSDMVAQTTSSSRLSHFSP